MRLAGIADPSRKERRAGIEPAMSLWKRDVLPLALKPQRAGEGNRTLVACLEGRSFAIKLHPQIKTLLLTKKLGSQSM